MVSPLHGAQPEPPGHSGVGGPHGSHGPVGAGDAGGRREPAGDARPRGTRSVRRAIGVDRRTPLALVAREMLSAPVELLVVFDSAGAVGRVTWRDLARALATGADPQIATAADFMTDLEGIDDPFWARA
jgi:hypothetical protein